MRHARLASAAKGILALAASLIPPAVAACPACAGRNDATSWWTVAVLGGMMLVPFAVAGVVVRIVRRVEVDSGSSDGQIDGGVGR